LLQKENKEGEKLARMFLAQFRAGYGRFINDPWWATQIAELSRISPAFRELWARHDVLNGPEGCKSMHHPLVGELTFDFFLLQMVDSYDLRLLIYSPRSKSGTAEKIERLLASELSGQEQTQSAPVLELMPAGTKKEALLAHSPHVNE
jgi:hypothetical protein